MIYVYRCLKRFKDPFLNRDGETLEVLLHCCWLTQPTKELAEWLAGYGSCNEEHPFLL